MIKQFISNCAFVICVAGMLLCSINLTAQNRNNDNGYHRSLGFDVGAPYGLAGASYDQRFKPDSKYGFRTGIGYGFAHTSNFISGNASDHQILVPFIAYRLFGNGRNNFELGLGMTAIYENEEYAEIYQDGDAVKIVNKRRNEYGFAPLTLTLGYRLVTSRRFQLRTGMMSHLLYIQHNGWSTNMFYPYVGFSWNL